MKKNKRSLAIAALLFVFIFFLSQCINNEALTDPRGNAFAFVGRLTNKPKPAFSLISQIQLRYLLKKRINLPP